MIKSVKSNYSRELVLEKLSTPQKYAKKVNTKELATTFLNYILIDKRESFSERSFKKIEKKFKLWTKEYLSKTHPLFSISPSETTKHNITSIPNKWTYENFASTEMKESKTDPLEKKLVQENLETIAKATFTTTALPAEASHHFSDLKLLASIEQLARAYAYRSPKTAETIRIYSEMTKKLEEYTVEVIPLHRGIHAFGLVPTKKDSQATPILLFRGTSLYPAGRAAGATLVTDVHPIGIGYDSYQAGRKRIGDWINRVTDGGKQIFITGHSLGSAYASYAAIDYADKVKTAFRFGATKISFLYFWKWQQVKDKLTLLNFNTLVMR